MPTFTGKILFRAAVQAEHLLAAAALTTDLAAHSGVTIERHHCFPGVVLASTSGAEIGMIYSRTAAIEGYPQSWRMPYPWLLEQLRKIEIVKRPITADQLWAVLTYDGVKGGSIDIVLARSGAEAMIGGTKKVKTILKGTMGDHELIVDGRVPAFMDLIEGAKAVDRKTAPARWLDPAGLGRVQRFADALSHYQEGVKPSIAFYETKRPWLIQIAFRDFDEAAVFTAVSKDDSDMRPDNPGWLEALL